MEILEKEKELGVMGERQGDLQREMEQIRGQVYMKQSVGLEEDGLRKQVEELKEENESLR